MKMKKMSIMERRKKRKSITKKEKRKKMNKKNQKIFIIVSTGCLERDKKLTLTISLLS